MPNEPQEWPPPWLPLTLTRRDAIEWICYVMAIRHARYVPATRHRLEMSTLEQVEKAYNDFFGPQFLKPVHFTVIEGEDQMFPLPTPEEVEAARQRARGPNARD
jgi:hypothetical protein